MDMALYTIYRGTQALRQGPNFHAGKILEIKKSIRLRSVKPDSLIR